jgi:hypothetical protein
MNCNQDQIEAERYPDGNMEGNRLDSNGFWDQSCNLNSSEDQKKEAPNCLHKI